MLDSPVALTWLAVLSLGVITLTVTSLVIARELHQTLRQLNTVLPHVDQALQEAHHALRLARRLLGSAQDAAQQVALLIRHACGAASGTLTQWTQLQRRARRWLSGRFGNGARVEPRSRVRRSR